MLQKGYKREGKGMAVLRCFIGLFIVFIGVLVGYSILGHDYSSGLDPTSSLRNYIEATPTITPQMPAYTPEVSATPTTTPTPTPTPTLSPTPTISPTPEPTAFPQTAISPYLEQGKFVVPEATTVDYRSAITHSYVSKANDNSVIELRGYGYLNDASFEGNGSQAYLVVTMESTGVQIAYQATMIDGCSGVAHTDALCANASSTDFSVIIDVSVYPDDIYSLELVMGCYIDGTPTFVTMPLPEGTSMTVLGKKVISGVPVASVE